MNNARVHKLTRPGLKLIYKIRHHRGHGIHSPFVYNLVRTVIEEKAAYYAYTDIDRFINTYGSRQSFRTTKLNKLVFRFINHFGSKNILEIGSGKGLNTLFLTASSNKIKCTCFETNPLQYLVANEIYKHWNRNIRLVTDQLPELADKQDCIYIDLQNCSLFYDQLIGYTEKLVHEKSIIIISNIRTNKHTSSLWKKMKEVAERTVAMDLYHTGILFYDKGLSRWDYQISF